MKAIDIFRMPISKAPKEWEAIDAIKASRPPIGRYSKLVRIKGTDMCYWISAGVSAVWNPSSGVFVVEVER